MNRSEVNAVIMLTRLADSTSRFIFLSFIRFNISARKMYHGENTVFVIARCDLGPTDCTDYAKRTSLVNEILNYVEENRTIAVLLQKLNTNIC